MPCSDKEEISKNGAGGKGERAYINLRYIAAVAFRVLTDGAGTITIPIE